MLLLLLLVMVMVDVAFVFALQIACCCKLSMAVLVSDSSGGIWAPHLSKLNALPSHFLLGNASELATYPGPWGRETH